ncbi:metallophosphoesterase [Corallococcus exiguus]|uniref:metallophosphoesterase n=1 Tax=Corallococcus TaxID=83461 RepID=UPI000ECA610B|nr:MULTISPECIES: metallophosphoesterase [Corallococcus]NNC05632.1 metallophosphoesterase [Corallococcus exiguus]NPC50404.1 metallophosphoesterase [Corallococcus exiguus]RKH79139.1 metallophosphoesterase [Corallococcus sp. AB032C]
MVESPLRIILFVLLVSVASVYVHVYLYRRLFRDTSTNRAWRTAGKVLLTALCVPLLLSWVVTRIIPSAFIVAVAAWTWMGVAVYLLLSLALLGAVRWLVARTRGHRGVAAPLATPAPDPATPPSLSDLAVTVPPPPPAVPPVDEARRLFLSRATAGSAVLAAGGLTGYGMWSAFHPPVVNEVAVRLPGLPKALDGFTLVHMSDIHVGPIIQRRFMDELVRRANALKPDLVAITGDLVDGTVADLRHSVAALQNLQARAGTHFITGNHEYYWNASTWADALTGLGVTVLRNRHVTIGDAGGAFDLVGVDDWSMRNGPKGYNLDAAIQGRNPDHAAVLLAHQPSNWDVAAKAGMGLQLSGHTHGGQFFPFTVAVSAIWKHDAGLFQDGDNHLYVSRGTGFWGPPLRVAAPSEIVKVTLLA